MGNVTGTEEAGGGREHARNGFHGFASCPHCSRRAGRMSHCEKRPRCLSVVSKIHHWTETSDATC